MAVHLLFVIPGERIRGFSALTGCFASHQFKGLIKGLIKLPAKMA